MTDSSPGRFDDDKIEDAVLALLHLNAFSEKWGVRAWKSFDWDALDRLHEKGLVSDPRTKAKSVLLTDDGQERAREAAQRLFCIDP